MNYDSLANKKKPGDGSSCDSVGAIKTSTWIPTWFILTHMLKAFTVKCCLDCEPYDPAQERWRVQFDHFLHLQINSFSKDSPIPILAILTCSVVTFPQFSTMPGTCPIPTWYVKNFYKRSRTGHFKTRAHLPQRRRCHLQHHQGPQPLAGDCGQGRDLARRQKL